LRHGATLIDTLRRKVLLRVPFHYLLTALCWWAQVRRHGAEHDDRQSCRRSLLSKWCSCHCSSCSGDRIKFQSHIPPESADRQTKGTEGICIQSCRGV